jgi:hypothetical protein
MRTFLQHVTSFVIVGGFLVAMAIIGGIESGELLP